MTYLVDANVLSEATKPKADQKVLAWLRHNETELAVDPIILGEIRFGIDRLPSGRRRQGLEDWFDEGVVKLVCVPLDAAVGLCWAKLLARLHAAGEEMPVKDSLIAASALYYDLTVATRNVRDFKKAGVKLIDPFA